ncbi:hypothetical protein Tco_1078984 [Tanacetum coccineum]|uniref:Uncharacterized protein n=1 Tax=Tanacetum coccineum TaxID=301880 RepID=A0ABQ5HRG4_9ASTR
MNGSSSTISMYANTLLTDDWSNFQSIIFLSITFCSLIQKSASPVQSSPPVTTKVPAVTTTVHAKPIQNSPLSDDLTSDPNKKTTEKGVRKEGFGCALNMSKGSHLGLRHCATNRKRKKRKGPFVWTKSKSRVVIEVGQTEAIDGGLNCDSRLANYEQPCQHFLMFDYDPQEGELQERWRLRILGWQWRSLRYFSSREVGIEDELLGLMVAMLYGYGGCKLICGFDDYGSGVDIPFKYRAFFLDDDVELDHIRRVRTVKIDTSLGTEAEYVGLSGVETEGSVGPMIRPMDT